MKKLYIAIGVLVFIAIVVVAIPAQVFAVFLDDYRIHLLGARGTVWNGSADLVVPTTSLGRLEWQLRPSAIFKGNLEYEISLRSSELQISGMLIKGLASTFVAADAKINPAIVNSVLLHYDLKVSGSFALDGIELHLDDSNSVDLLSGNVRWDGGTSRYLVGDETRTVDLPPIVAELSTQEGDAVLVAFKTETKDKLMSVRLEPDSGWVHIAMTSQMLELAQMPWESNSAQDAEVLKVSRQIFR